MAGRNEEKIYSSMKSLEEWALAGVSEKEMADLLGMAYSTFRDLKRKIPALSALLKKSAEKKQELRKKRVAEVEKTLLQRCLGYNAQVKKQFKLKRPLLDEDGQPRMQGGKLLTEEVLEERTEEQHVPADIGAIKFFLLNQAREAWKNDPDRLEIEKKRLANDTKRTKLAQQAASGESSGRSIEEILAEAERKSGEGGTDGA